LGWSALTPPSAPLSRAGGRGDGGEVAAPHRVRLGRPPRGLQRKPESVRKHEGDRNVITLSRFLWLEQRWGRRRCRRQPPSPWEQWILKKRAFWAGHVTHGFWFASLRPSNVETPGRGRDARATSGGSACTSTSRTPSDLTRYVAKRLPHHWLVRGVLIAQKSGLPVSAITPEQGKRGMIES
jgi:hypothetical protein